MNKELIIKIEEAILKQLKKKPLPIEKIIAKHYEGDNIKYEQSNLRAAILELIEQKKVLMNDDCILSIK
jgi:hypothetical protein